MKKESVKFLNLIHLRREISNYSFIIKYTKQISAHIGFPRHSSDRF